LIADFGIADAFGDGRSRESVMRSRVMPLLFVLLLPALSFAQSPDRTYLKSQLATARNLPFSSAVLVGDTLYIAGTTAIDPGTANKTISAEEEARRVMNDVKQVVEQAGMTMDDIVSIQVFCTDLATYDTFNRVYSTYFHGHYPARAFVGISALLFGARYEVKGIAIKARKGKE
jgi:2-iminobutanoate/2-iminopropanoate deaminase